MFNCNCKCTCTTATVIAGIIIGVFGAFFQITGGITLTPLFLAVALGIALVYLGVLLLAGRREAPGCCGRLGVLLTGILGTILVAAISLAVGIAATVLGAILTGLLLFFLTLVFGGAACLIRCLFNCGE